MIDKGIEAVLLAETKNGTSVEETSLDMEDEGIEMDDVALSDIGPLALVSRTETEVTSYCSSSKRKKLAAAIIVAVALFAVVIVLGVGVLSGNKSGQSSDVVASANGALTLEDCLASFEAEEVLGNQVEESVEDVADEEEEEEETPGGGADQADASLNKAEETGEESESTATFDEYDTFNNAQDLNVEPLPQQRENGVSDGSNDFVFSKQHVVAATSNKVAANGGNSNDNGVDGFLVRRDLRGSGRNWDKVGGLKLVDPSSKSRRLQCEKLLADQATRVNSSAKSGNSPEASESSEEDIRRMLRRS
mmetsp:Transcript_6698/g.14548  ORF Transcript_6698/g.14548 Transcript_6698/m.14548 type:complete len:306 (+) Transcript_6698:457-1374(+)